MCICVYNLCIHVYMSIQFFYKEIGLFLRRNNALVLDHTHLGLCIHMQSPFACIYEYMVLLQRNRALLWRNNALLLDHTNSWLYIYIQCSFAEKSGSCEEESCSFVGNASLSGDEILIMSPDNLILLQAKEPYFCQIALNFSTTQVQNIPRPSMYMHLYMYIYIYMYIFLRAV